MKQNLFFAALITLSAGLFSCGGESVSLKLHLQKGDTFASTVKMDQKINTAAMGMKMNIDQHIEVYQRLEVNEVNSDSSYTISLVTDRFYMKQSMPMMGVPINVEYDTDKPEKAGAMGEAMGQYFEKMKGLSYDVVMDNHGKIIRNNMEEVYKKLGLDSLTKEGGNNNSTGGNAEQYVSQLPDKPVKEGDSYVVELTQNSLVPIGTKSTYTVKEITAEKVLLEVTSEFLPGTEVKGVKMEVKGSQTGTVEVDRKTGMTLRSEIKQKLDMTINANGMNMPMTTEGTIVFTCEKK